MLFGLLDFVLIVFFQCMVRVRGYSVFSIVKLAAERQHVLVEASMPVLQSFFCGNKFISFFKKKKIESS